MQRQRLFGVLIIVLIIVGLVLFLRGGEEGEVPEPGEGESATMEDVVNELTSQLGVSVPEDVERTTLTDVSGGSATGLATRKYEDGLFTHTVLAALPDPRPGTFYEGWLVRGSAGDDDFSVLSTGRLSLSKGGYLLDFTSDRDLLDHSQVVVTEEAVDDGEPETHIMEGSF